MKILVLGGGDSPEREISFRSSSAVRDALTDLGHEVGFLDPKLALGELVSTARQYDLVLPILHGVGGEDGVVQKLLDEAGTPYLGADTQASELCFDKARLLKLLEDNGITVPPGEIVTAGTFADSELVRSPFVLKPNQDGSSVDTLIVRTLPYDKAAVDELLKKHSEMLLEKLIEGTEITVPVLGDEALPVIEIIPPEGKDFDFENKYNGATAELCPPQNVAPARQVEAQRLAEKIHKLSGARHLSRTDMIVTKEGTIYVLEINTIPGLTAQSLFPKSAEVAGLPWHKLVARFVELASGH